MKKHFKSLKRLITILLLATILYTNTAPDTPSYPDIVSTCAEDEHSDSGKFSRF